MTEKENEQLELLGKHYDVTVKKDGKAWWIALEHNKEYELVFETTIHTTLQGAIDEAMEGVGL